MPLVTVIEKMNQMPVRHCAVITNTINTFDTSSHHIHFLIRFLGHQTHGKFVFQELIHIPSLRYDYKWYQSVSLLTYPQYLLFYIIF